MSGLGTIDRRILGALRRPPPFKMVYHPRRFNKPSACKDGKHPKFVTKIVNGWPQLVCIKCGAAIFKGAKEGTVSRQEARDKMFPKNRKIRTKKDMILESWAKMQEDQRRGIRRRH